MIVPKEISILQVLTLLLKGKILWTEHITIRLRERRIKRSDLFDCIKNGEIIEQYPDDTPYPSCLISGTCTVGKPLHVVVGLNTNVLCCMITAYQPDSDRWKEDFKTRKDEK